MNKIRALTILYVIFSISACSTQKKINHNLLNGKWIYMGLQDDNYVYENNWRFKHNKHGVKFKKDGIIKKKIKLMNCVPNIWQRVNIKTSGTWDITNDSIIHLEYIHYKNNNGLRRDTFKIVNLTLDKMILTRNYK